MFVPLEEHFTVSRTARFYTLGGEDGVPAEDAWFVLHGYSQLAGDFIRYFAEAAAPRRLIVAPEALNRYYLVPPEAGPAAERPVGATWMTRADREHEIEDYVGYLDALREALSPRLAARAGLHVIGFSQGAATATRWLLRGRSRIDRLTLWGGLLPPDAKLEAPRLHEARLTYVIGDRDKYISATQVAAEEARLRGAGVRCTVIRFDGGHSIKRDVVRQLAQT